MGEKGKRSDLCHNGTLNFTCLRRNKNIILYLKLYIDLIGASIMILVFALAGTFTATIAGVTALIMGQPWWIGLASYIAAGMLTVFVLAIFAALTMKITARRTNGIALQSGLSLAEQ